MPKRAAGPLNGVIVFDLDGTVLSVNSFPLWAMAMVRGRFPTLPLWRRAGVSVRAIRALLARKAGMISHETLKWRLQRLWQDAARGDDGAAERDLAGRLARLIRPELAGVLAAVATGRIEAVLATAAAADYAEALGRSLGFRHVLATPRLREEGSPSTVGVRKRDAVLTYLERRGWGGRPIVFFTDHAEDLPLILRSHTVYWFGKEEERRVMALRLQPQGITLLPGIRGQEILSRVNIRAGNGC
jgi:phosphoserine phosphatase